MAETLRETPVDELMGLPLPIAPDCQWVTRANQHNFDTHHGIHPRTHPLLATVAGRALRTARLQEIKKSLHNEGSFRYHRFFGGPNLDLTEDEIFERVLPAVAGFLSDEVIDTKTFADEGIERRRMSRRERKYLTALDKSGLGYRHLRYDFVRTRIFFAQYVVAQPLVGEQEKLVDEFLGTEGVAKIEVGRELLWRGVEMATDRIRSRYVDAYMAGQLHPASPPNPEPLVLHKLGNSNQRDELLEDMEVKLRQNIEAVAA